MKEERVKELPHVSVGDSLWAFWDSGLRAIFSAAGIFIILLLFVEGGSAIFVAFIAALVHAAAYTVLGLPLYLIFWPKPGSIIWRWQVALPLGFLLGCVPFVIISFESMAWLLTGCYGLVSALASLWVNKNRPRDLDDYN
ncbi:MAG: hypothetical protein ACI9FG_001851 [Crocinitomicaceae bacterium]|jgi:hypothetical protein